MAKEPEQPSELHELVSRVAALEDKLAKMQITEDEWKAYHKVAAIIHGGAQPSGAVGAPCVAVSWQSKIGIKKPCAFAWTPPCIAGPCSWGGPAGFGGGFGDLGT
jgi:hypothetical protein